MFRFLIAFLMCFSFEFAYSCEVSSTHDFDEEQPSGTIRHKHAIERHNNVCHTHNIVGKNIVSTVIESPGNLEFSDGFHHTGVLQNQPQQFRVASNRVANRVVNRVAKAESSADAEPVIHGSGELDVADSNQLDFRRGGFVERNPCEPYDIEIVSVEKKIRPLRLHFVLRNKTERLFIPLNKIRFVLLDSEENRKSAFHAFPIEWHLTYQKSSDEEFADTSFILFGYKAGFDKYPITATERFRLFFKKLHGYVESDIFVLVCAETQKEIARHSKIDASVKMSPLRVHRLATRWADLKR